VTTLRSQIIYATPKSQNYPAIKARGVTAAWDSVRRFLDRCTDASAPATASFVIYESPVFQSTYSSADLLNATRDRFGRGLRRQWCSGAREEYCWEWRVDTDQVDSFVQFLSMSEPLPNYYVGPAQLTVSFDFRWVQPSSKELLPYQDPAFYSHQRQAQSHAVISLSRLSSVSLDAYLPFAAVDSDFLAFCDQIAPFLPARFPGKHFRFYEPNRRGNAYVAKKLDLDLVFEIDRHLTNTCGSGYGPSCSD
jgi:hypothetical protein